MFEIIGIIVLEIFDDGLDDAAGFITGAIIDDDEFKRQVVVFVQCRKGRFYIGGTILKYGYGS